MDGVGAFLAVDYLGRSTKFVGKVVGLLDSLGFSINLLVLNCFSSGLIGNRSSKVVHS